MCWCWWLYVEATLLDLDSEDDVLEDLVERVPGVQAAVRVGWSIVQEELVIFWPVGCLPVVEVVSASLDILVSVLGQGSWSMERTCVRASSSCCYCAELLGTGDSREC